MGLSVATETVTDKRWQVPGQPDMVIHRPDLSAKVKLDGQQFDAVGYSKRYFGDYPEHWGYRFIHGTFPGMGHKFLWTADATFGDSKYNYFKLVDGPDFYESERDRLPSATMRLGINAVRPSAREAGADRGEGNASQERGDEQPNARDLRKADGYGEEQRLGGSLDRRRHERN